MFKKIISGVLAGITAISITIFPSFSEGSVEKKAIYYLPGYMGSQLYDRSDGKLFWIDTNALLPEVYNFPLNKTSKLALDENGEGDLLYVDVEKDNSVEANAYGTRNPNSGEYSSSKIMERLKNDFSDEYDVKFFSYDWRKSLPISIKSLEEDIKKNGYNKVTFVCHSAGGLLAAGFLGKSQDNVDLTEKVVTLGTPLLGTYTSLVALQTGNIDSVSSLLKNSPLPMDQKDVFDWVMYSVKNSSCLYQLIPSKEFLTMYPVMANEKNINEIDEFYTVLENSQVVLNNNMITGDKDSHLSYRDDYLNSNIMDVFKKVNSYHIAGTGRTTEYSVSYNLENGYYGVSEFLKNDKGDGTVSLNSAIGAYYNKNSLIYPKNYTIFSNTSHSGLTTEVKSLDAISAFIRSGTVAKDIDISAVFDLGDEITTQATTIISDVQTTSTETEITSNTNTSQITNATLASETTVASSTSTTLAAVTSNNVTTTVLKAENSPKTSDKNNIPIIVLGSVSLLVALFMLKKQKNQ